MFLIYEFRFGQCHFGDVFFFLQFFLIFVILQTFLFSSMANVISLAIDWKFPTRVVRNWQTLHDTVHNHLQLKLNRMHWWWVSDWAISSLLFLSHFSVCFGFYLQICNYYLFKWMIALRSYTNSTGGGFFCQIHAQPAPLPALQPVSPSRFISSGQSFPQRSVSYVPVQQTSQQYVPVYQSGFQPSYQPGYSQQTYQSGSRGQQSYQSPYYVQGSYRPVPVSQSQPQPQPQPPTQVQASPQSRPSFQPAYQQPGYQPVYQQSYPASSSTIQQSQPPAYNGYQSGFSSGYQNGFQNTYQSGYQPNGIPSERKPGYPVVSSYTPQQPVYQPLGPQGQTQCQTQCGLRKKVSVFVFFFYYFKHNFFYPKYIIIYINLLLAINNNKKQNSRAFWMAKVLILSKCRSHVDSWIWIRKLYFVMVR